MTWAIPSWHGVRGAGHLSFTIVDTKFQEISGDLSINFPLEMYTDCRERSCHLQAQSLNGGSPGQFA